MKNSIKKISLITLLALSLNAQPINQNIKEDGYEIKLISLNSLAVGDNKFVVELSKDASTIKDAKVKIKFFMPEMPGMPYMESLDEAELKDGKYELDINFPMGGTWQYQLKFKTEDKKIHSVKGSINL